jgi:hypothetical protein
VIWTPGFIVLFSLVCALGLSLASILTQGWLNKAYPGEVILLGYVLAIVGLWVVLLVRTKNQWVRLAAIFGILWVIFTSGNLLLSLFHLSNGSVVAPHLVAVTSITLLGSAVGLALAERTFDRWDRWFFWLAPLVLPGSIVLAYLLGVRALAGLENVISGVALCLCMATWWLRPSSWRLQAVPALLFGFVPLLLLLFNIPHRDETNFFYTQVLLLALILGLLCVIQRERGINTLATASIQ